MVPWSLESTACGLKNWGKSFEVCLAQHMIITDTKTISKHTKQCKGWSSQEEGEGRDGINMEGGKRRKVGGKRREGGERVTYLSSSPKTKLQEAGNPRALTLGAKSTSDIIPADRSPRFTCC